MARDNWHVRWETVDRDGISDSDTIISGSKNKMVAYYNNAKKRWVKYIGKEKYEEACIRLVKDNTYYGGWDEMLCYQIYSEGNKLLEEEKTYAWHELIRQAEEKKWKDNWKKEVQAKSPLTKQQIIDKTQALADQYKLGKIKVLFRDMSSALGNASGRRKIITYSYSIFKEPEWKILHTIYHEVAHIIAYKRHGDSVNHCFKYHVIEKEVCKHIDLKLLYAREIGYATAFIKESTGEVLKCKYGYKVIDGKLYTSSGNSNQKGKSKRRKPINQKKLWRKVFRREMKSLADYRKAGHISNKLYKLDEFNNVTMLIQRKNTMKNKSCGIDIKVIAGDTLVDEYFTGFNDDRLQGGAEFVFKKLKWSEAMEEYIYSAKFEILEKSA